MARLIAWRTPGHTAEGTTYMLEDAAAFTGDSLFTGGVGRPDLEGGTDQAAERARSLYASVNRLLTLPGQALVLPGHASEQPPVDQRPIAATIGDVRAHLELLQLSEGEFASAVTRRLPAPPPNHFQIVDLNESGRWPDTPVELEAGPNRCAAG